MNTEEAEVIIEKIMKERKEKAIKRGMKAAAKMTRKQLLKKIHELAK
jgi:hypothetical protein